MSVGVEYHVLHGVPLAYTSLIVYVLHAQLVLYVWEEPMLQQLHALLASQVLLAQLLVQPVQ
jgi:hypothetical protein